MSLSRSARFLISGWLALAAGTAHAADETAAAPVEAAPAAEVSAHPSAVQALGAILARAQKDGDGPRVVAFGEYHETVDPKKGKGSGAPSALRHFTDQLLGVVASRASDLVLETWITDGNCGKKEAVAVQDVQKTTKRPETTENELVTLVKQAKSQGIQPHILKLSCEDYNSLLGSGEVDYEKLLKLITDLLYKKITEVAKRRSEAGETRFVMVYGGAVHNDLVPKSELASYSFGPQAEKSFPGRYVEVDLYVPEYIERDPSMTGEPWYAQYKKRAKPAQAAVVRRSAGSYILIFPRSKR